MIDQIESTSNTLEKLFVSLNNHQIQYVVSRRYDRLPKETLGGDVDIYVVPEDFDDCVQICKQLGFSSYINSSSEEGNPIFNNIVGALKGAVDNPEKAIEIIIESPADIINVIYGSHSSLYRSQLLHQDDIPLEISDHLTYTSPYDGSQIRVNQSIEQSLFNHRHLFNGVYVPSPPDELAHIIPHCVFDKKGHFSKYYINRCDLLVDEVTADDNYDDRFRTLLNDLFYSADQLVYELAISGDYNSIRSRLRQFDDY